MMMISNTTGKGKELCKDLESFFFFFFSQSFLSLVVRLLRGWEWE